MASAIDPTKPESGNALTADQRANWAAAKSEIEALQSGKAAASHTHPDATTSVAGFLSAADKTKLDGIAANATANSSDATLLNRVNHTGTQTASTISDLTTAVQALNARVTVENNGTVVGARRAINFIPGTNVSLSITDDSANEEVDVTINASGGAGDMVLASTQTVTGAKTFNDGALLLNNVAGTFSSRFTNTNTAARTYTLRDRDGAVMFADGDTMTGALNWAATQTIASAATTNIAASTSNSIIVSGTTTITALGTIAAGAERLVRFSGALTLTHNATSLILPGGANITTAAGDVAYFVSEGAGNWRCTGYQRASGASLVGGNPAGGTTEVQYRVNATTFGAMAGTAWDNTNRALTITGATVTASNPILNLSQTWNAGAVTFVGQSFNVTDTASAATSQIARWQVGGADRVAFRKDGAIIATLLQAQRVNGSAILQSGVTNADYAFRWSTGGIINLTNGDNTAWNDFSAGIITSSAGFRTIGLGIQNLNGGLAALNNTFLAYVNVTAAQLFVTGATTSYDTALGRNAAGVVEVNNGTAGTFRDLRARLLRTEPVLTANLIAPATAGAGARSFVTDSNSTTFGAIVAGGGANGVPVYCDGTGWRIG